MLKIVIAILFSATLTPAIFGQTEKQISSIRAEVGLINKSSSIYQKKTKSVENISLEGTEATYFTSGRGLKKITAKMYGETYRATAELYFQGEELIFVYQKFERYNGHIAMNPPPKVAKTRETRVYFVGGEAVRVIEGRTVLATNAPRYGESVIETKELAETLKKAYLN